MHRDHRPFRPLAAWILAVGATLLLAACAPSAGDGEDAQASEPTTLTFATFFEPTTVHAEVYRTWFDLVEERSDGAVQIETHESGTLVGQGELVQALEAGRIDLAMFAEPFYPAELPISQLAGLPFVTSNGEAHARALDALLDESEEFRNEYADLGIEVILFAPNQPIGLISTEPVATPADLEGMRVRGLGFTDDALEAVGASPTAMLLPEVYEGLDRGVIDAALTSPDLITALRWDEVADHFVEPGTGLYVSNPLGIREESLEALPPELQDVLFEAAEEAFVAGLEAHESVTDEVCRAIADAGGQVTVFADDEVAEWEAAASDEIQASYLESISGEVDDPEALLGTFLDLVAEHEERSDHRSGLGVCE